MVKEFVNINMPINICKMDDILKKINNIETNLAFQTEILNGFQSVALDRFTKLEESFKKFLTGVNAEKGQNTSKIDVSLSMLSKSDKKVEPVNKIQELTSSMNKVMIDGITPKGIESFKRAFAQILDLKSILSGGLMGLVLPKPNNPAVDTLGKNVGKGALSNLNVPAVDTLGKNVGKDSLAKMVDVMSTMKDNKKEKIDSEADTLEANYSEPDVFKDTTIVKFDGFTDTGKTEFQTMLGSFLSKGDKGASGDSKEMVDILKKLSGGKGEGAFGVLDGIFSLFGKDLKGILGKFATIALPKIGATLIQTLTKAFGAVFSSVGIAVMSIGASIYMFIKDGIAGIFKAKEWGVSSVSGGLGGMLAGVGKTFLSRFTGQALKWGLLGAGIGSVVPGIGTIIGGLIGVVIGTLMALIGGERIAQFFDAVAGWVSVAFDFWKKQFLTAFEFIKKIGGKVYDGLKWWFWDMPISLWKKLFDGIGVAFDWASDAIKGVFTNIKNSFVKQFAWFDDVFGGIPSKIIGYIKQLWDDYAPTWLGGKQKVDAKKPENTVVDTKSVTDDQKQESSQKVNELNEIQKTNRVASIASNSEIMKKMDETSKINQDIINTSKELNQKNLEKFDTMISVLGGIYEKPVATGGGNNTSVVVNNAKTDTWAHREKYA